MALFLPHKPRNIHLAGYQFTEDYGHSRVRPSDLRSCAVPDIIRDHLFDHLSVGVRAVPDGSTGLRQE